MSRSSLSTDSSDTSVINCTLLMIVNHNSNSQLLLSNLINSNCLCALHLGGACRSRVTVTLQRKYATPEEAERLMCMEPEVADSLSVAIHKMEIADHPVSTSASLIIVKSIDVLLCSTVG